MTALSSDSSTVPLFATPFAAVNTGADRHFNERLVSFANRNALRRGFRAIRRETRSTFAAATIYWT